jgi:hypothetical protein
MSKNQHLENHKIKINQKLKYFKSGYDSVATKKTKENRKQFIK